MQQVERAYVGFLEYQFILPTNGGYPRSTAIRDRLEANLMRHYYYVKYRRVVKGELRTKFWVLRFLFKVLLLDVRNDFCQVLGLKSQKWWANGNAKMAVPACAPADFRALSNIRRGLMRSEHRPSCRLKYLYCMRQKLRELFPLFLSTSFLFPSWCGAVIVSVVTMIGNQNVRTFLSIPSQETRNCENFGELE